MLALSQYATLLRQELCARNASYAALRKLPHVTSYGEPPVVVYQPAACRRKHGNFISSSYRAILRRPEWRRRLNKVHSQGKHALPMADCVWRELDSSMSSDALLMNIFCYPGVTKRREVTLLLGTDVRDLPEFGFRPRVPLLNGAKERTEIDMKLGSVLFEAKLTEGNFQVQHPAIVEQYCDLKEVFECSLLPRKGRDYVSYQLVRNVLAAHALNLHFCVLLDARRPDLLEQWYRGDEMYSTHRSSDQMQGPNVARARMLPARGSRTLSEYQIWNRLRSVMKFIISLALKHGIASSNRGWAAQLVSSPCFFRDGARVR